MTAPSIDDILRDGRKRQKKLELSLGVVLLVGGLAMRFGFEQLSDGSVHLVTYGAAGLGALLIARGLFGSSRG